MKTTTITRSLLLIETQNICAYYNHVKDTKLAELPIKTQWLILSAIKQFQPKVIEFEEFRDKKIADFRAEYFGKDKSEDVEVQSTDENGKPVFDDDGNPVYEQGLKVKDEFIDEYKENAEKLNNELNQLLVEKTDYTYKGFEDFDEFVDSLPEDTDFTLDDINMLSFLGSE